MAPSNDWQIFGGISREKQEADSQLKELKDQLEAEQYFTVTLTNIIIEHFLCTLSAHSSDSQILETYLSQRSNECNSTVFALNGKRGHSSQVGFPPSSLTARMYVQWYETDWIYLLSFSKTLYKTQIRELKDECDERNKLYKETQQQLAEYQEERFVLTTTWIQSRNTKVRIGETLNGPE